MANNEANKLDSHEDDSNGNNNPSTVRNNSDHFPFWKGEGYYLKSVDASKYDERYEPTKIEFNLPEQKKDENGSEPVSRMGKLVTKNAAKAMRKDYIDSVQHLLNGLEGDPRIKEEIAKLIKTRVIFGKEALLFLLAQPNCEGIRFYSCLSTTGKRSLVLIGVDAKRNDLENPVDSTTLTTENASILGIDNITIDSEKNAGTGIERQKSAIVEVGGTDRDDLIKDKDIVLRSSIITLYDEIFILNK